MAVAEVLVEVLFAESEKAFDERSSTAIILDLDVFDDIMSDPITHEEWIERCKNPSLNAALVRQHKVDVGD